jgi:hypothetical protein
MVRWNRHRIGDRFPFLSSAICCWVSRFRGWHIKLKHVTGRDHRSIQRYIIGVIAGRVPRRFLVAIRALVDFRYLAQAPVFSDQSLGRLTDTLQLFHNNKDVITQTGARDSWGIPKLELFQSVVSSIRRSGPVMQWSANATEHAHVQEIKVPARASNNQNYYEQITCDLDRSDKCSRLDVATYITARHEESLLSKGGGGGGEGGEGEDFDHEDHAEDSDSPSLAEYISLSRSIVNYFALADAISCGLIPNAPKLYRTFTTSTTTFHIANKPSLRTTIDEAAALFGILDLRPAIWEFFQRVQDRRNTHDVSGIRTRDVHCPLPFD